VFSDSRQRPLDTDHWILTTALLVLFLTPRLALLFVRAPFFDELFTQWIAVKPFAERLAALKLDSGPPLYYTAVHLLGGSILAARLLSLACATVTFLLVLRRSRVAAALLAVYPAAVLMAVDGRAYSMCAMFVALGLHSASFPRPAERGEGGRRPGEGRPLPSALAFVAAAYTHYYGVLFFPLLLLKGRRGAAALALAILLFLPGLWLGLHQPAQATAWNAFPPYFVLLNPSFAGVYSEALFASPPWGLVAIALAALVAAAVLSRRVEWGVLIPIAGTLALAAAGRSIYFPLRFESVIAVPLVLWIAGARRELIAALMTIGIFVVTVGIIDHAHRPPDHYRAAALAARRLAGPGERVVATGFLYLESVAQLGPRVEAYPPEQARHPGWRALDPKAAPPHGSFVWVVERQAPELALMSRTHLMRPLYANDRALVMRVTALP
jgi:hypothetical protein